MLRVRATCAVVFVVAASIALGAQKKPDFSGTWAFDASKSEVAQGPAGGRMGGGPLEMTVVIKQTAEALVIEQKTGDNTRTLTYRLDGTESVNRGMRGTDVKSTSRWEGDTLVTEGTQTMSGPGGEVTIKSREVRSLGADGTMVVQTTRETPRGAMSSKLVFKKAT